MQWNTKHTETFLDPTSTFATIFEVAGVKEHSLLQKQGHFGLSG